MEDVTAYRSAIEACETVARRMAVPLFDPKSLDEFKNGWNRIEKAIQIEMDSQLASNPNVSEKRARLFESDVVSRVFLLFGRSEISHPKELDMEDMLGQRSLDIVNRSISKNLFPRKEEDILKRSTDLCERFGFSSVRLAGERSMSPLERVKSIQNTTKDLARACNILGISESEFGKGSMDLTIDVHLTKLTPASGTFQNKGTMGSEITVNPRSPSAIVTLVHEYVHNIDSILGVKALAMHNAKHGIQGPMPIVSEQVMFSNLSEDKQDLFPDAKEGLRKIFSALSVAGAKSSEENSLLDSAAHALLGKTVGVKRMIQATDSDLKGWMDAVRSDNDALIRGLASSVTSFNPGALFTQFFEDHEKAEGKPHSFAQVLKKEGMELGSEKALAALDKFYPVLVKLAPQIHPLLEPGMTPSPFLKSSVQESVKMARFTQWERNNYFSSHHEMLARLVARPNTIARLGANFGFPFMASPMDKSGLNRLEEGFKAMTKAAGMETTPLGPNLSIGNEIAISKTVTPVFKALQSLAYLANRLSGQRDKVLTAVKPNI